MSQLPTPGLPKPRYSGIPSAGKSGLPAPGSITRSAIGSGAPLSLALKETPSLTRGSNGALGANGVSKLAGRPSTAPSGPTSPEAASSKPTFGAPRQSSNFSRTSFSSAGPRSSIGRPPSSSSATSSRYGEQTVPVTPPRRQSNVYKPSSAVKMGSTPRSTVTSRSESRMSDAITRDSSRASQRPLEVGDPVKIESLALEGTLRFLGEITGKPGQWAGVELSGKFAGKGKNDGSAAGVSYFSCPPKCGVFVASTKIAPTLMGPPSIRRPGSVASSHGRDTPSIASPTDARQRKVSSMEASILAQSKISAGSRASKYIGITAKQLSNRDLTTLSSQPSPISPRKSSIRPGSPPRTPLTAGAAVTQTTPKAPRTSLSLKPRASAPSLATPKPGRAQLGVARHNDMPPPPVPDKKQATPSHSQTTSDDEAFADLPNISLTNGTSPSLSPSQSGRSSIYATPSPEPSNHVAELEQLRALVQKLEIQNKELQNVPIPTAKEDNELKARLEEQKLASQARIAELETSLHASERASIEKQGKLETLERLVAEAKEDITKARAEGESRVKEVKVKLEESEALVGSLKGLIDDKASAASENDATLAAKQAEIEVLQGQVTRVTSDLEHDRTELGAHIEELRKAGQETIALYEERISAFEAERYDAEALIQTLEERLKEAAHQPSSEELARQVSTAAQIDNETLREQVAHFQQRIQHLEDQLEEAQAAAEREEAAVKARLTRYKEKDTQRQQELEEARQLAATAAKYETTAKTRIEELEEALRENTAALEDARAEIEALRTDLAILENSTETTGRNLEGPAADTYATEAKHLKALLDASKLETRATADQLAAAKSQAEESSRLVKDLRDLIKSLEKEKADLLKSDSLKRSRDSTGSGSSRTKDDNLRDQISGLKVMNQELQKENSAYGTKIRTLEAENKALMTEVEDLKESIKNLEQAMDESILREERMLEEEQNGGATGDSSVTQRALKESRSELEQLRKKLSELEKKSAKTISELNKEVADLESLVEAKIYREDDLEREVERLKDKVQRLQSKSSSKSTSGGDALGKSTSNRGNHTRSSTVTQQTVTKEEPVHTSAVCEICEQAGHDIFSCPLLKDDESSTVKSPSADMYCVDCDSRTHNTADCPHSQDVF